MNTSPNLKVVERNHKPTISLHQKSLTEIAAHLNKPPFMNFDGLCFRSTTDNHQNSLLIEFNSLLLWRFLFHATHIDEASAVAFVALGDDRGVALLHRVVFL